MHIATIKFKPLSFLSNNLSKVPLKFQKLAQSRGAQVGMISRYTPLFWMGSWTLKRILGENYRNLNKVWMLVNNNVSVLINQS